MTYRIPYNTAKHQLRYEHKGLGRSGIDSAKISILDTSGNVLLAETTAYQYGIQFGGLVYLDSPGASPGDTVLQLDTLATPRDLILYKGDRLRLIHSKQGPAEDVVVESYDDTSYIISLKDALIYGHSSNTEVEPLFATHDLDTTNTTTWVNTMAVRIIWQPVSTDADEEIAAQSYMSVVNKFAYDFGHVQLVFADIYPSVHKIAENRFDNLMDEAYRRVSNYFRTKGRDMDTLTDQTLLITPMVEQLYLLAAPRSDEFDLERAEAKDRLNLELERLEQGAIWFDENEDSVVDEDEVGLHPWYPVDRGI
jgi:hypothetical protein